MTTVSDRPVSTLRALLKGNTETHNRMLEQLGQEDREGYMELLAASFFEAVDQRFAKGGSKTDVVAFVGNIRMRSQDIAESVDPRAAERMILAVFTDEDIEDIPDETKGGLYILLLAGLIAEARPSDAELDKFLSDAREIADGWLSAEH